MRNPERINEISTAANDRQRQQRYRPQRRAHCADDPETTTAIAEASRSAQHLNSLPRGCGEIARFKT